MRLKLGSLVQVHIERGPTVATVIGTWYWTPTNGTVSVPGSRPRDTRRVDDVGQDPTLDDRASGYLLLPSAPGVDMLHASFDDSSLVLLAG